MGLMFFSFSLKDNTQFYPGFDEFREKLSKQTLLNFKVTKFDVEKLDTEGAIIKVNSYKLTVDDKIFQPHEIVFLNNTIQLLKYDPGIDYLFSCMLYLFSKETILLGGGFVYEIFNDKKWELNNEDDIVRAVFENDIEHYRKAKSPYFS